MSRLKDLTNEFSLKHDMHCSFLTVRNPIDTLNDYNNYKDKRWLILFEA